MYKRQTETSVIIPFLGMTEQEARAQAEGTLGLVVVFDEPQYKMCIRDSSSLLPNYRGAAPIHWAVLNGDRETGVTIMHMAHDLDAGDIIAQAATPVSYTHLDVYKRQRLTCPRYLAP